MSKVFILFNLLLVAKSIDLVLPSQNQINNDLHNISKWKMRFNSDPSNEAQEVIFKFKKKVATHPQLRLY